MSRHSERCKIDSAYAKRHRERSLARYYRLREDPTYIRRLNLERRFGITLEQYEEMYQQQQGLCAICNRPETFVNEKGVVAPLSVDHNHTTRKVRQLLCRQCNSTLGLMGEKVERLQACIDYLLRHNEETPCLNQSLTE